MCESRRNMRSPANARQTSRNVAKSAIISKSATRLIFLHTYLRQCRILRHRPWVQGLRSMYFFSITLCSGEVFICSFRSLNMTLPYSHTISRAMSSGMNRVMTIASGLIGGANSVFSLSGQKIYRRGANTRINPPRNLRMCVSPSRGRLRRMDIFDWAAGYHRVGGIMRHRHPNPMSSRMRVILVEKPNTPIRVTLKGRRNVVDIGHNTSACLVFK
jgi:hypothetical protein